MRRISEFLLSLCPEKSRWNAWSQLEPTAGPVDWSSFMLRPEKETGVPVQWTHAGSEATCSVCANGTEAQRGWKVFSSSMQETVYKPGPQGPVFASLWFIHPWPHDKHSPFLALLTPTKSSCMRKNRHKAPKFTSGFSTKWIMANCRQNS